MPHNTYCTSPDPMLAKEIFQKRFCCLQGGGEKNPLLSILWNMQREGNKLPLHVRYVKINAWWKILLLCFQEVSWVLVIKKKKLWKCSLPFSIVWATLSSMSLFILIAFLIPKNEIKQGLLQILFRCQRPDHLKRKLLPFKVFKRSVQISKDTPPPTAPRLWHRQCVIMFLSLLSESRACGWFGGSSWLPCVLEQWVMNSGKC